MKEKEKGVNKWKNEEGEERMKLKDAKEEGNKEWKEEMESGKKNNNKGIKGG